MEPSTFTIRFRDQSIDPGDLGPGPDKPASRGYWLDLLRKQGAEVEAAANDCFVVRCYRKSQLQNPGRGHCAQRLVSEPFRPSDLDELDDPSAAFAVVTPPVTCRKFSFARRFRDGFIASMSFDWTRT